MSIIEHTQQICVGRLIVDSEHTRLQDILDSTWITAVFFYCHYVIPAVCWKPCQLKPKGRHEATPSRQMNLSHVSVPWDRIQRGV